MSKKWIVVTEWESRVYRSDYLVQQDEDGDEVGERKHLYSEFRETIDSGEIETISAEDYMKKHVYFEDDVKKHMEENDDANIL